MFNPPVPQANSHISPAPPINKNSGYEPFLGGNHGVQHDNDSLRGTIFGGFSNVNNSVVVDEEIAINKRDTFQTTPGFPLMHYFEDNTRNLYLVFQNGGSFEWRRIEMSTTFKIPLYHSSIMTPTNAIMLAGGYSLVGSSETFSNTYMLDFQRQTLTPVGSMLARRAKLGLIRLKDHIYAVGGTERENKLSSVERVYRN